MKTDCVKKKTDRTIFALLVIGTHRLDFTKVMQNVITHNYNKLGTKCLEIIKLVDKQ